MIIIPFNLLQNAYAEVVAYVLGERNCIIIDKEYAVNLTYSEKRRSLGSTVIIFRSLENALKYDKMVKEEGEDYAKGVALGYPPTVAKWFQHSSISEHVEAYGIKFRSWHFVCPVSLLDDAVNFYAKQFNADSVEQCMTILVSGEYIIGIDEAHGNDFTNERHL